MKLGMVTYQWGAKWDLPTLIKNCAAIGFEGVELRSTHAHGVEPTISKEQRQEVRKRFEDSPVVCVGLGSACEFQNPDHGIVQQNIELAKEFVRLSHDIGASGVKVRPNSLVKDESEQTTIERIADALRQCGRFAADYGQEIRVEVHGRGTASPSVMERILRAAAQPNVRACWNSNPGETVDGSLRPNFDRLKKYLGGTVHIHDLYDDYPYRELFALLRDSGWDGYCLSESPATDDPLRVMRYYKALFGELARPQSSP